MNETIVEMTLPNGNILGWTIRDQSNVDEVIAKLVEIAGAPELEPQD